MFTTGTKPSSRGGSMPTSRPANPYEARKRRAAKRQADQSREGREIGPLPPVKNKRRKAKCKFSLRLFCEIYLAASFFYEWSADQLKVIARLERAILKGGLFALAMPRGSGKSTICEAAALWAILYGHRRFVVIIGATDDAAIEMLDSIKLVIEENDLILDDFPEAAYPVRRLEGITQRANAQTLNGKRTRIEWDQKQAVFPSVPDAASSGARIRVAGITGRIRGQKVRLTNGRVIRPDLAIADDPQTDQSAESLSEIMKREKRLRGAVKHLSGPGETIAMVVPCTIIEKGDLSDRLLDRNRNPQFAGEKFQAMYEMPTAKTEWDEYKRLRVEAQKAGDTEARVATDYYAARRRAMDYGAKVAWEDRYDRKVEISALQALMNVLIDDPRMFAAEYQNAPETDEDVSAKLLVTDEVAKRLNKLDRFVVPRDATRITSMIDIGGELLWYAVVAWNERFGGTVIDYGSWPEQPRQDFFSPDARPVLNDLYPNLSDDQRVYAGLQGLTAKILPRTYPRAGTGEQLRVEKCLIDTGWLDAPIHEFVQRSPFAAILLPSKGYGARVGYSSVGRWKPKPGEVKYDNILVGASDSKKGRVAKIDVDHWKTFVFDRLTSPPGGPGYLDFFGSESRRHSMLARHCCAERGIGVTTDDGHRYVKWAWTAGVADNHLWDCLVGATAAASIQGLIWNVSGQAEPATKQAKRKLSEVYAQKQAEREERRERQRS